MALAATNLYKMHVLNLRSVDAGRDQVYRELKRAIGANREEVAAALLKVYLLLTGTWAESRLRKLLYEPNGFDDAQRTRIMAADTQMARWHTAVELGFRKRYGPSKAKLTKTTLPLSAWTRFETLSDLLNDELRPLIEMRNKLAHGQWERALTNDELSCSTEMTRAILMENALSVHFKGKILKHMAAAVHDLVSGGVAFERDFDDHFRLVTTTAASLRKRDFVKWRAGMIDKHNRGQVLRNAT